MSSANIELHERLAKIEVILEEIRKSIEDQKKSDEKQDEKLDKILGNDLGKLQRIAVLEEKQRNIKALLWALAIPAMTGFGRVVWGWFA